MSNAPIVIIGTGLAGYSLAREFRKLDKETPLLLISRDDGVSYSKPMLSTGFAKQKTADELAMADLGKMSTQLKASIRNFTEVDKIDTTLKQLTIDNEIVEYSRLVMATGATVNKLKFPGSDLPKVFSINDLADYRSFRAALKPNARVLIMGAGLIGCEYANDLLAGGHTVTIVDPASTALNGLVPEQAGKALVAGLENAGISFHFSRFVARLDESDSNLTATLDDGSVVETDIVISAVGLKPDLSLATSAGLTCERGIVTNRAMETSAKDVYALGDCAQIDSHVLLYVLPLMASAKALAKTLSGERTEVSYGVMPVATKTPACPVVVVPPLANTGQWEFEQDGQNIKGLFKDGEQIHGFVLTGDCVSEKQALAQVTSKIHH